MFTFQTASTIMETILQIAEEEQQITNQNFSAFANISANKLHSKIVTRQKISKTDLDNILHLICDDQLKYLSKVSESAGGLYQISKTKLDLRLTYIFIEYDKVGSIYTFKTLFSL